MKTFILFAYCFLLAGLMAASPAAAATAPPNIVIIMSDDMGWSDIGCYGGEIRTPNLDQLAAHGVRFTHFYNTGRCCPTRAALLTGLYSHQAGVGHMTGDRGYAGYRGELNRHCLTIGEVLRLAGYRTYAVGKWHVARNTKPEGEKYNWPLQRGFDHHYGIIGGASDYFKAPRLTRDNDCFAWDTDPEYKPETFYLTDAFAHHAVKFLNDHARTAGGKPFFLYLAFTAAHWPIQAIESDIDNYNGQYDAGYEAIRQARWQRLKSMGLVNPAWTLSPTVGEWDKFPEPKWEARMMQAYAAMVTRMDQGVGRVVGTLKENGVFDNTIIFFLQDNGACAEPVKHENPESYRLQPGAPDTFLGYGRNLANVSNTPYRYYKHWQHEGGISTPLIVHWPAGIPAARRNQLVNDPGHLIDLMATCVDVAQAKYPRRFKGETIRPMEGVSLVPALSGRPLKRKSPIFWEHEGNRAVRDGQWKLVSAHAGGQGEWELYDLEADRTEMHDLAKAMPDRVKKLAALWQQWAERVGVQPWPLKARPSSPVPVTDAAKPAPANP